MSGTKPTPGPWRVQDVPGDGYGKRFAVFSSKGDVLKGDQLEPKGTSIGEARANARAIAAVPDLLAIVQWIAEEDDQLGYIVTQARAALAKALEP
jgi:hypothetical protein